MTAPIVSVKNLVVEFPLRRGLFTAVDDVSFDIMPGEILGVVGESGAGKSMTGAAIIGLIEPPGHIAGGEIFLKGERIDNLPPEKMMEIRGKRIGMVFQDPLTSLNPLYTIGQQLIETIRRHLPLSQAEARQRAIDLLAEAGIPAPADRLDSYPHQFSGGMRQRVVIALALAAEPELIIADEPTSALDVTLKKQINDLLLGLRDEFGTSILYITHDLGTVAQVCDRVLVMYAGEIVEAGTAREIFETPRHPYTRALLAASPSAARSVDTLVTIPGQVPGLADMPRGCRFADRCPFVEDMCRASHPDLFPVGQQQVRCYIYTPEWTGRTPSDSDPRPAAQAEPASSGTASPGQDPDSSLIVEANGLKVHFTERRNVVDRLLGRPVHKVRAVDSVDFHVFEGEIVAVVGESGSGKTTLGRTVLRLQEKTGGELIVAGNDLAELSRPMLRAARADMQMIFQDAVASLSPRMRVRDLLLEPYTIHGRQPANPDARVEELLEMVELSTAHTGKYPHELSGGQARRVGIARALTLEPRLLIADEPTAGLDVSVGAGILNLLRDLNRSMGLSMVLITHDMNIIRYMAHRVAVMQQGKIVETGPTLELMENPEHPYTQELLAAVSPPEVPQDAP